MGDHHPECPDRLRSIQDHLAHRGLDRALSHYDAPRVSREQLRRVHTETYIQSLYDLSPDEGHVYLDMDNVMNPHTLDAALHAAGAMVLGVDLVMRNETDKVFCAVRPPGHHAERDRAMGFCFFNNVAVAAAHALSEHRLQRIAIVDFDVHHGNGTEDIFRNDERVLFCSSFQHPFYPYSGVHVNSDHIINVPLAAGSDGTDFRNAVAKHWLPALEDFQPQLVLISAGFDAHREDNMANLNFDDEDYRWVSAVLNTVAKKYADGRLVSTLEGGYALPALGRSVVAHIEAMLD